MQGCVLFTALTVPSEGHVAALLSGLRKCLAQPVTVTNCALPHEAKGTLTSSEVGF